MGSDGFGGEIVLLGVGGLVVLAALVALRGFSGGKLEVKISDAVIAVIPVVMWLLVTGKITKLVVGAEGVTVETAGEAILQASSKSISGQISALPVVPIDIAEKTGVPEIPDLVARRIGALEFRLGRAIYAGSATRQYVLTLIEYPFFRYVMLSNQDRSLFGIFDSRKLAARLEGYEASGSWDAFATLINNGDRAGLAAIEDFVPAERAVSADTDKRVALQRMEEAQSDWLPVVNDRGAMIGTVDRARLTASLILDVAERLEQSGAAQP